MPVATDTQLKRPKKLSYEQFKKLPSKPYLGFDVAKVQAKYDILNAVSFRKLVGTFRMPRDIPNHQIPLQEKVNLFVRLMGLRGWTSRDKPVVTGPFSYRDIETGLPDLAWHEYRIEGAFAIDAKPVRMEIGGLFDGN